MPTPPRSTTRRKPAAPPGDTAPRRLAGIGDAAVEKATGHAWEHWLRVLDRAGAARMPHDEIALVLHEEFGVGDWWAQMVTVGYEQARGLRQKYQSCDGRFQGNASKTVPVPLAVLFDAWNDPVRRARWLPGADLVVRRATPGKSMRITWEASAGELATNLDVNFYAKGPGKSQVALNHTKLGSPDEVERSKAFWAERLTALQAELVGEATAPVSRGSSKRAATAPAGSRMAQKVPPAKGRGPSRTVPPRSAQRRAASRTSGTTM
ncbi:MAG TPA: DUF4287 domain-containing protein [Phycisphaerales bacterium]|nr:DUF4287 domain-containing protein [Phycisphaerales bacterium]